MGLAIVAIPEEQDRVWKFSSEKVPHLTLLFLGDEASADTQQIVQFVEHATQLSEHGPFYLDVESRGELGADQADVLFFSKRSWNLKWIKQFRGQLLQNDAVRTAYDSAEQFGAPQDWLPHLTMGYPETPAKPVPDDDFGRPFYSVCFDRIAVWTGNYDGPEFKLEWPEREFEGDLAIAYAEEMKKALTHHGVKGMKWGQVKKEARDFNRSTGRHNPVKKAEKKLARKTKSETVTVPNFRKQTLDTKKVTPKKAAKLDQKWQKEVTSMNTFISVHNAAADHVNKNIDGLNAKFDQKYKKEIDGGILNNESHPITQAYHKAYVGLLKEGLDKSVKEFGPSPTGKYKVKLVTENEHSVTEFGWSVKPEKVEHAATENESVIVFVVKQDDKGRITNIKPKKENTPVESTAVEHGAAFVEGLVHGAPENGEKFVLEHYGVKGMRWGQTSKSGSTGGRWHGSVKGHAGQGRSASPEGSGVREGC
jgi:2'-5' RNA ligase